MHRNMKRVLVGIAAGAAVAVPVATTATASDDRHSVRATMRLVDGTDIGRVRFTQGVGTTVVNVSLEVPPNTTGVRSFHGFHIHANDNPANGDGCIADPAAPFVSADGHLGAGTAAHGSHVGDMPSLHLDADGTAEARFEIDRISLADLANRAVILHAGPDNFGNIPVGAEPTQYTANSAMATDLTSATGNAGARVACGVITTRS